MNLSSVKDNRKWTTVSPYSGKDFKVYRGQCSRRGKASQKLIHRNARKSLKCECEASVLFSVMEEFHSETTTQTYTNPIHIWEMMAMSSTQGCH